MNIKNSTAGKRKSKMKMREFRQNMSLTLLALPSIVLIFVFNYIPLYGLLLPFKEYNVVKGIIGSPWCGLKNFEFLIKSKTILIAIKNTILYNIAFIVIGTFVAILIALLLYELGRKSVKTYQTMMLIPYFMSWVVVSYVANVLFDMDSGVLNSILKAMGKEPVLWYNEGKYWPGILIIAQVWKGMGYNAIVYFAALMSIDSSYFEAARIDGANKAQQMWYISLPLIKQIVIIMFILNIGSLFRGDFGLFYNVPLNSALIYDYTDVIDTYVYRSLVNLGNIGMSATTGFCQSVIGFILVVTTNLIVRKIDKDSALF